MEKNEKSSFQQYYQAFFDAIKRVWKYKFLWFWGIFLPSGFSSNLSFDEKETALFDEKNMDILLFHFKQTWLDHSSVIIFGLIILLFILILFWVISAIARAGIIISLNHKQEQKEDKKINNKKEFKKIYIEGKKHLKNILTLDIIFLIITFFVSFAIVLPIIFIFQENQFFRNVLVVILAILIFIPIIFILIFTKNISLIFISLIKEKPLLAIEHGYNLLLRNKGDAFRLFLAFIIFYFITSIAIGIFFLIAGFFLFNFLFILLAPALEQGVEMINTPSIISISIISLIILAIILLIKSFLSLCKQDVWLWWVKKIESIQIEEDDKETEQILEAKKENAAVIAKR